MPRHRPRRLDHIQGIGVDKMGDLADSASSSSEQPYLRLENLDVNIPPDQEALSLASSSFSSSSAAAPQNNDNGNSNRNNSYLPFTGQHHLRSVAARHVSRQLFGGGGEKTRYSGRENCIITAGGLSGILNVLLATIEEGDEVILTDPTYRGLINRVLLAGGVPRFVPFIFHSGGEWKLDRDALRRCFFEGGKSKGKSKSKITAMLLMSPSMPTGAMLDEEDWRLVGELCVREDLLLILDAAMERLVFDDGNGDGEGEKKEKKKKWKAVRAAAGIEGMEQRIITVGSASKELRMIGWRVGWVVGPEDIMRDVAAVSMGNVVVPVGVGAAQEAVAIALERSWGDSEEEGWVMSEDMRGYVAELRARRDLIISELEGLPVGVPAGGWSLLLRVSDFGGGMDGNEASRRLLKQGVCATSMDGWGEGDDAGKYIRFVFSNESRDRLKGLGKKVRRALDIPT